MPTGFMKSLQENRKGIVPYDSDSYHESGNR